MSKSIGKLLGAGSKGTSYYAAENKVLDYLNDYDTSLVDNTLANLENSALDLSGNLGSRPGYVYSVDGSDEARQRMENAVYQSFLDKTTPQFERQTSDLQSSLLNQGLSVGSEAYQRAMSDLQDSQNQALNQAAYQSVQLGQDAFSQSLNDSLKAGNFQNSARQLPVNEIMQLLNNSVSGYDKAMDIYAIQNRADNRVAQNKADNQAAQYAAGNQFLFGAISSLF